MALGGFSSNLIPRDWFWFIVTSVISAWMFVLIMKIGIFLLLILAWKKRSNIFRILYIVILRKVKMGLKLKKEHISQEYFLISTDRSSKLVIGKNMQRDTSNVGVD